MEIKFNNSKGYEENNKLENEQKKLDEYMKYINHKYINNPNFKFKSEIINTNNTYENNYSFEIYISYKDNKLYIASHQEEKRVDIFSLLDNKKIISLNHKESIQGVKYFFNKKNSNEYLVTISFHNAYIWDISNDKSLKYKINMDDGDCLLIFLENNNDYIITSSKMMSSSINLSTKIYSFNDYNLIRYISESNEEQIQCLLYWYNKKNNKNYFIQLAYGKILINNLLEDELYAKLVNYKRSFHYSGFIFNKDNIDYLFVSSNDINDKGLIELWDLFNKNLFKVFKLDDYSIIYYILILNYKYILIYDWNNKCLKIFDLDNE